MERRIVAVKRLEVNGKEPGLPVVSVDDIGSLAAAAAIFEDGSAEEREAKLVVAKIAGGIAVDPFPIEKGRVLDEDDAQTGSKFSLVVTGAAVHRVDGNMNRADKTSGREGNVSVTRKKASDVVAPRGERFGESGGDIGQPPRLRVGGHFGRRVDDAHESKRSRRPRF